ncbi:MAG: sulfatase [Verrucomicrobiales bacterium]
MKSLLVILSLMLPFSTMAEERPNILWITSEDNAAHWLGCYGNELASTPRLDRLAGEGLRFTRAYANGPVCAVARSTILMGAYATTMGTQHMRSRYPLSPAFIPYVTLLRQAGYYCTNNSKTDYNFKGNDAALWDECSHKAHYRNRPEGKPFMAVFNMTLTHESQLFPGNVKKNRQNGVIPKKPRLDPAAIKLPPSQPDLPEMREDAATYHDCMTAMDEKVGAILDELAQAGLAEDTIVFYYSDHGGAMARGKRYLEDSGVRVPMLVRIPEKWSRLSPWKAGTAVPEPVAFIDLAPTILSLTGVKAPESTQGRAFLGEARGQARDVEFVFGDRFDENPGMRRAVTDGKYKYIRCFTPHLPATPYCEYPLGQPSWTAWKKAAAEGKVTGYHRELWELPRPVENLFDLESDPWEIKNLAGDPAHAVALEAMRSRLKHIMISTKDTGVVPESLWEELAASSTIRQLVVEAGEAHRRWVELAFLATSGQPIDSWPKGSVGDSKVDAYWVELAKTLRK